MTNTGQQQMPGMQVMMYMMPLMTVWMGVSIFLLCNEDESAALLPFALIKAGAMASFIASLKILCMLTDRKLI